MAKGIKTGGRKKGILNKFTHERRKMITEFLNEDYDLSLKDWKNLKPFERWQIRTKLEEFVTPKLQRAEMTGADGKPLIPITELKRVVVLPGGVKIET